MPKHAHGLYGNASTPYAEDWGSGGWAITFENGGSDGSDAFIEPSGGGSSHNNMPAYQELYAWRRTA